MKKTKRVELTAPARIRALAAISILLVGVLLYAVGSKYQLLPLRMAAWLHFAVGGLWLFHFLYPLLCSRATASQQHRKEQITSGEKELEAEAPDAGEEEPTREPESRKDRKKKKRPSRLAYRLLSAFLRWSNLISLLLSVALLAAAAYFFVTFSTGQQPAGWYTYLPVLAVGACFVLFLVLSKALLHLASDKGVARVATATLDVLRFNLLVIAVGLVINVTGLFDVSMILRVWQYVLAAYCAIFLTVSLVSSFLRGECRSGARLFIPRPFAKEEDGEEDLISYLERSTGMTLRSLFGIRIAKKILPIVALVVVIGFWLSTGISQVETYERGALYRCGRVERILEPGVHLTLPWPFDKVELYETEKVQEMVVGYEDSERTNLLWDESHGGTEYKLLLGDGNELVSVNFRIKYKIDDLYEYVTCSAEPAEILNARAYSAVTELTVRTTLDAFLAEDRAMLSQNIEKTLGEYLDTAACGLAVTDVIIESIHPPVELASIYRDVVSAELEREAQIDASIGIAESTKTYAELRKNQLIQEAEIRQNNRVAEAEAAVAEFMAMVDAYDTYPDAFCYYKYLEALSEVYQGQRLYILGDGIDERYIYFKDGVVIYNPAS